MPLFDTSLVRPGLDILNQETVKNYLEFIFLDIPAPPNLLTPLNHKSMVEHLLRNNSYQTVA